MADKPMFEQKFIILKVYEEEFALALLAHGGGGNFPSQEGVCLGCNTKVFYESIFNGEVKCPGCGGEIKRTGSQDHRRYTDIVRDWCPYLARHAKAKGRV